MAVVVIKAQTTTPTIAITATITVITTEEITIIEEEIMVATPPIQDIGKGTQKRLDVFLVYSPTI